MKKLILFSILILSIAMATEFEQCAHLLHRTSFGITEPDITACLHDESYEATVKRLLDMPQAKEPDPLPDFAAKLILPPKKFKKLNAEERKALTKKKRKLHIALKQWWITKMLTTQTPFRERMVLFWHNHFTSSIRKVQQPALIYRQLQLFRSYSVGNFAQLLHKIIEDPAMLTYLDNRANRKKHPNENLARELLELFTLGEGHYSEQDIKEVARTLTGYSLDKNRNFRFKKGQHDKSKKIIFGQKATTMPTRWSIYSSSKMQQPCLSSKSSGEPLWVTIPTNRRLKGSQRFSEGMVMSSNRCSMPFSPPLSLPLLPTEVR